MIFKNIAEYEDKDSELAKFTISQLHCKIQELESQNKELARLNIEKIDTILKAIEYIKDYLCSYDYTSAEFKDIANVFMGLLDTLQGVDKE